MKRGALVREVQILLQNVTKMPPEKQHAARPYMSQPSVHPLHKALFKVSPHLLSSAPGQVLLGSQRADGADPRLGHAFDP